MPNRSIRVVVVEEHDELRAALVDAIETLGGMDVIWDSGHARGALATIARLVPDVAVLDFRMSDGNGLELCRAIRDCVPATRCLLVSARERQDLRRAAFEAGAAGFVVKTARISALIDEIGTAALVPAV